MANRASAGKSPLSRSANYDQRNLESAKIILSDVAKYGGETAGLVIWARMAIKRIEQERRAI
jgi:hypothetical protein